MTFKDIRQGQAVYLLHKGDEIRAEAEKARQAGTPRFPQYGTQGGAMGMVVDITVGEKTYVVPADSEIACAGNVVISVSKEGMLREVEAMRAESAESVDAVDRHRKRMEDCERILEEWDEKKAEEKRQEEKMCKLENKVDKLSEVIMKLVREFKG